MYKKFLLILILSLIILPVQAKNPFRRQMPVVTGVPSSEPLEIDEEFTSDFIYYDEVQAKQEAKSAKIQQKIDKKREKLVNKKLKLEKKLQQSKEKIENSNEYIELLKRPVDRTGVEEL